MKITHNLFFVAVQDIGIKYDDVLFNQGARRYNSHETRGMSTHGKHRLECLCNSE